MSRSGAGFLGVGVLVLAAAIAYSERSASAADAKPERIDAGMLLDLDLLADDDFDRHRDALRDRAVAERARMLEELDRLDRDDPEPRDQGGVR